MWTILTPTLNVKSINLKVSQPTEIITPLMCLRSDNPHPFPRGAGRHYVEPRKQLQFLW